MCGSNLMVRSSSFIYLNSFVEKTRLSPPGGGVIEESWVGGWALGVRAARRIAIFARFGRYFTLFVTVWLYYSNDGD